MLQLREHFEEPFAASQCGVDLRGRLGSFLGQRVDSRPAVVETVKQRVLAVLEGDVHAPDKRRAAGDESPLRGVLLRVHFLRPLDVDFFLGLAVVPVAESRLVSQSVVIVRALGRLHGLELFAELDLANFLNSGLQTFT